ncbi:MAG TPA: 16S rRNA (uracil(1498)-N(3))-methyltransferase [candidate division Zixibacteria bacterium]|nr:16S rRNA (uracil(1498)-N(3))-methyltransferase [candidate division Zixibacteria bacterium]
MIIRTTYFYAPGEAFSREKVFLDSDEAHHLVNVLRAKEGDEFFVTNGMGELFRCRLTKYHKKGAVGEIVEKVQSEPEPSLNLTVGVGVIRSKKLETALDWLVQLGVSGFVPLLTDFAVKKFADPERYLERMQKIAIRAIKQSLRTYLPRIYPVMDFLEFLKRHGQDYDGIIYADPDGVPAPPRRMRQNRARIFAIVGCEGGLSSRERSELAEYDAVPLSLGVARLRTETAAVVLATKLFVWSGDI